MNIITTRSWWETLSREALQAQAKLETTRMQHSKIGQWKDVNAEMEGLRRTRRHRLEEWERTEDS